MKINTFKTSVPNFWLPPKLLLIIVIMITSLLQVSASILAQKITLNEQNVPLDKILIKIRAQSGYDFIGNNELIKGAGSLSIRVKELSLDETLRVLFAHQNLTYLIQDKAVVIKERDRNFIRKNNVLPIIDVRGRVLDEKGLPLSNASIKIKGTSQTYSTNNNGEFVIRGIALNAVLQISFVGYKIREISAAEIRNEVPVIMELINNKLEEVNIVSTGYQNLSKERATGSFEKINNEQLNRRTGTNVLSRLLGAVPGVYFNNKSALVSREGNADAITIRGISSFAYSVVRPLVVLDNIPYDGDPANLNPNDIEDITILKDAAAASIWGTRAGNGVIVITTKKGDYNKSMQVSLNSNVTVVKKPDLFYIPQISSSDAIDVETFLFDNNFYDNKINTTTPFPPFLTPVVELLIKKKVLPSTDMQGRAAIDEQINALRKYDVRTDYLKYTYRNAVNQQYALNLSGGSKQIAYLISGGFDKNLNSAVTSNYNRATVRSNVSYKPLKRLDINTSLLYTQSKTTDVVDPSLILYTPLSFYPYARLADDAGNPLAPGMRYRNAYLDNLNPNPKLMDWKNRPLDERYSSSFVGKSQDILFNLGLTYTFNPIFSAEVKYQYENTKSDAKSIYNKDAYYTRGLTNELTDPTSFISAIPAGGVYTPTTSSFNTQTIRGQINAKKNWSNEHDLVVVAGAEARESENLTNDFGIYYGFDPASNVFQTLNTKNPVPLFFGGTVMIPNPQNFDAWYNRFTSLFANAAYTYHDLYTVSSSIRKDASNVFGDNANKQGTPLWSTGLAWNLSNEKFYKFDHLPYLKLRATYGYSGNVVTGVPAYAVVTYAGSNSTTGLPYAQTTNLPNPDLRWEKVGMLNIGLDFRTKNNILSGSIEYFDKRASDLVASTPIDLTKGSSVQTLNSANLHGKGIDLTLNTLNINGKDVKWNSNFLFSYNRTITTRYLGKQGSVINYIGNSSSVNPIEGKDAYAVLTYQWAGLDPLTGDPQGYLNGEVSKDYVNLQKVGVGDLHYFGSSIPLFYGAFRNTFSFKGIEVSANILYKFKYFFKRPRLNYTTLFNLSNGHQEYVNRWQNPGDEKNTDVPSMVYPANSNRDIFYNASAATVEKGDHIRIQDISAAYLVPYKIPGIKVLKIYINVSNVGIIWRANDKGLDPDIFEGYPFPRTVALGFNVSL